MSSLREARESRGIKQSAVALHLGVSRPTYAKYEAKPEIMPVYKAQQACEFIGCDIRDIFFGSDVSFTQHEDETNDEDASSDN